MVGALTANGHLGASGVGAAYVYEYVGSDWQYERKLTINDPLSLQDGDMFGWSVAVDGTTAVVGGRDEFGNAGIAYVFDTVTGSQTAKLSASDNLITGLGDTMGSAVAISGDYAVVGATAKQAAYVFMDDGLGNWSLTETLTGNDTLAGDQFGFSVALDGTTAVVGARRDNNPIIDLGSAYVFDILQGTQIDKFAQNSSTSNEKFGHAVAIEGDLILSGALEGFGNGLPTTRTGSAFLFAPIQAADFEEDGDVDGQDLLAWQGGFGMLDPDHKDGDADLDGDVDGSDFLTWQSQFQGASLLASQIQVPEPGSLLLWLTGAGLLCRRQRAAQAVR